MKSIITYFKSLSVLFTALFSISCTCDTNEKSDTIIASQLPGKWYWVQEIINNTVTVYEHQECAKDYINFKSDNTFEVVNYSGCNAAITDYGIWKLENTMLTISGQENTYIMDLYILNNDSLIINGHFDADGDGFEDTVRQAFVSF